MKAITIKSIIMSAALLISCNALATNRVYQSIYSIDSISLKQLNNDCGPVSGLGTSSIFGSYSNYIDKYPNMGILSSELESIRIINSDIKLFANKSFVKAKAQKDNVYLSNNHNNSFMERNKEYIAASSNLKADTMDQYNHGKDILQDTSDYISENTINEIIDKLKEKRLNQHFYFGNNYDVLLTCRQFWSTGGSSSSTLRNENNTMQEGDLINKTYRPEMLINPKLKSADMTIGNSIQTTNQQSVTINSGAISISAGSQFENSVKANEDAVPTVSIEPAKWWD